MQTCHYYVHISVLPEIRVDNEIHSIKKPSETLPSQAFQVVAKVIKGQRAGKGAHFVLRPDHKGHIRSPKGTAPFRRGLVKTLVHTYSDIAASKSGSSKAWRTKQQPV